MKEKPLEGIVKDIISNLRKEEGLTEEEIIKAWNAAVGKRAASHSLPASLRRSRLVVNVDGSSWLYELTLKKREILKKLDGKLKGRRLKDIRFRIGEVKVKGNP